MNTFDVAIVGSGVIGASIAFQAAGEKLRVVLLDRQEPGREASWAAAGMLSPAPDTDRDIPLVPLAKESLRLYPEFIAAVEEESQRSTAYGRPGALEIFASSCSAAERDRFIAQHRKLGLTAEPITTAEARKMEAALGPGTEAAAWLPDEGVVEPRLLMDALLTAARNRGVEIRSDAHVTSLLFGEGDRCVGVLCPSGRIEAKYVVVAAGCFSAEIPGILSYGALTRPVRGQMVALRSKGMQMRHVLRSSRAYVAPRRDGRIVAGSTIEEAGFEKCVTPAGLQKILAGAIELAPSLASAEVVETWCGLRPGTPDDLPILGPAEAEGLLMATGHYRNGILLAPATAQLTTEWITRGTTRFDANAFSPLRFSRKTLEQTAR